MTIMGKTHFTYLKSSKNKSQVETAIFFVKLVGCKTASPPPVPDVGEETSNKKQAMSRLHSQPHRLLVVATFHMGKTRSTFACII